MFATRKDGKQYPFVLRQKRPNPCRFGMNERIFSRLCFGGELLQRFGVIPSSEDPTLSTASVLRYITVFDGSLSWTVPPSSPTVRKREESPLSHPFSVMEYVHPRKLDLKRFESTSDCERRLFLRRDCFCVKLSVENAICDSNDALLCCVILSKQESSDSSSMISLPIEQCVPSCALGASAWKDRSSFFLHRPSSVHPLHLHSLL